MARKDWVYAHAEGNRTGLMVCHACNKPITEGQYRYRDAGEKFVLAHRRCSATDPQWVKLDKESAEVSAYHANCYRAAKAFVNEFGLMDLEEVIEDYESRYGVPQ